MVATNLPAKQVHAVHIRAGSLESVMLAAERLCSQIGRLPSCCCGHQHFSRRPFPCQDKIMFIESTFAHTYISGPGTVLHTYTSP
jgi:hypothetical protein